MVHVFQIDLDAESFHQAPRSGRIFHTITKQRTGAVQYDIQGELLAENSRIHLNVLDAWRRHQPQAKLISLGGATGFGLWAMQIHGR